MNFPKRLQEISGSTHKKSSESGWVRKSGEACEILKDAICFKQSRHFNFFKAKDDGVYECKNNFRVAVTVVPLFVGEFSADEGSHLQLLQKLVEEIDAPKVGEHPRSKGNANMTGTTATHFTKLTFS